MEVTPQKGKIKAKTKRSGAVLSAPKKECAITVRKEKRLNDKMTARQRESVIPAFIICQ